MRTGTRGREDAVTRGHREKRDGLEKWGGFGCQIRLDVVIFLHGIYKYPRVCCAHPF